MAGKRLRVEVAKGAKAMRVVEQEATGLSGLSLYGIDVWKCLGQHSHSVTNAPLKFNQQSHTSLA